MDSISVADARQSSAVGRSVLLRGWIRTRRDSKAGFSFLELNDGTSLGSVQVITPAALENYESEVKHLTAGASVAVEGLVRESPAAGQATEVEASRVTVIGSADAETEKDHRRRRPTGAPPPR